MLRSITATAICLGLVACLPQDPGNPMEGLIMSRHAPPKPGQLFGVPMPGPAQPGGGAAACDASVTAGCPPAAPVPAAPAAPAEESYYMDVLEDLVPDPELHPATRELPDLADAGLEGTQERLVVRKAAFQAGRERLLSSDGALDCLLDEDLRWLLATGRTEQEFARTSVSVQLRPTLVQAVLLEGDCRDGRPEGDFVAIGRFESVQGTGDLAVRTVERRRVEGTLVDGRPDGEFLSSARVDRVSASMGPLPGHDVVSSRRYRGGEAQGPLLTISEAVEPDGTLSILTTEVGTVMAPRTELSRTYIGSQLQMESMLVEGVLHGWMRIYDVRLIKDYPSPAKEPQQLCYQHGRQAPESACAAGS